MANLTDAIAAAKKAPSERTAAEQRLVDKNSGEQRIRNADFAARHEESYPSS